MTQAPAPGVAVIGGGPAGLIACEVLAGAGITVTLYDRMPSLGRKLLMAGRGGLNLTHSEPLDRFLQRYGEAAPVREAVASFPPSALVAWCEGLGETTFTGSSGRVFPVSFKASPLLRAWLARLRGLGVAVALRHRFQGFGEDGSVVFDGPSGETVTVQPGAVLLALGGASWPRLGSDGGWAPVLAAADVAVAPFRPANCGFRVAWSDAFRTRFAGTPLKRIALAHGAASARGEATIVADGIEGGAVYALSAPLRDCIARDGSATLQIDLRPDLAEAELARRLAAPRAKQSLATTLRKRVGLAPVAIALLREGEPALGSLAPDALARRIKALPIQLLSPAPLARAISTAGGVALAELDAGFMLRKRPGTFVAGEMLDWEAPTGGYLLQASVATGIAAAEGVLRWLGGDRAGGGTEKPQPD